MKEDAINLLGDKYVKLRFGHWLFILCALIFGFQILSCIPVVWNRLKPILIAIFFGGKAEDISISFSENKDFLGTAVWTLTTVLSAFLVSYYNQQHQMHYGVAQRRIIAYDVGTMMIPLCVLENIIIVILMTYDYYSEYVAIFYFRALSSILVQFLLITYCIRITSQKHCLEIICSLEKEWLSKAENQSGTEGSSGTNRYFHLIPLMLDGEESINEKFAAIYEVIETCISSTQSDCLVNYCVDSLDVISSWMKRTQTDQAFLYDMVARLQGKIGSRSLFSGEHAFVVMNDVLSVALMVACADMPAEFDCLWDKLKESANDETIALLRVTLELMVSKLGYGRKGVTSEVNKKVYELFRSAGEQKIGSLITKKSSDYIHLMKRILSDEDSQLFETIIKNSRDNPLLRLSNLALSDDIALILYGDSQ